MVLLRMPLQASTEQRRSVFKYSEEAMVLTEGESSLHLLLSFRQVHWRKFQPRVVDATLQRDWRLSALGASARFPRQLYFAFGSDVQSRLTGIVGVPCDGGCSERGHLRQGLEARAGT